jgi:hypothetical protein
MGMKGGKLQVENWEAGRFFVGGDFKIQDYEHSLGYDNRIWTDEPQGF